MKQHALIIFESVTGRDQWKPILPSDVPEWVKDPDIIARMMDGEICMNAAIGDKGSLWYYAEQAPSDEMIARNIQAADDAEDKRARKNKLRLVRH